MKTMTLEHIDWLTISVNGNSVDLQADGCRISIAIGDTDTGQEPKLVVSGFGPVKQPEETADERRKRQNRDRAKKYRDRKRDAQVTENEPVDGDNNNSRKTKKETSTSRIPTGLNSSEFVTLWETFKTFRTEHCASRYERGTGRLYEEKFLEELEHYADQDGIVRAIQILEQTMATGWIHKLDTRREQPQATRELTGDERNAIRVRCWRQLGYTGNCWDNSRNPFSWDWPERTTKEKEFEALYTQQIKEALHG